jgi:hypothetical protein
MMRAIRLAGCVPLCFLGSCCHDDDDCWWTNECYWSDCCYTCYDVQHCDHYHGMAVASDDLDFDLTVGDAGDGKVDVLVSVSGKWADGSRPLSVRLIGPEVADLRRESGKAVWGFYGIPIFAAERVEICVAGTDDRVEHELFLGDIEESLPCNPRNLLLGKEVIAPVPEGLALGTDLVLKAPGAADLLASGTSIGLEIEIFRPDDPAPQQLFLREGEGSSIRLDRAGLWTFRSTLLADDLCGGPSADSVVVEETEIEVR